MRQNGDFAGFARVPASGSTEVPVSNPAEPPASVFRFIAIPPWEFAHAEPGRAAGLLWTENIPATRLCAPSGCGVDFDLKEPYTPLPI